MTDAGPEGHLHRYLQTARDALLWKLEGRGEYDVRRPMTPTGTNLLGLLKHLAYVEMAYVEMAYFGPTFGRPVPEIDPWLRADIEIDAEMWATPDESREDVLALYRRGWAVTDATEEELPSRRPARCPGGIPSARRWRCTRSSCTWSPRPTGTPAARTSSAS